MRFHPIALVLAFSGGVSAVPASDGSHQAKALGLWQKPVSDANATQHIRFAMISPGAGDNAVFNALCTLGLPTTHNTRVCSTAAPMIGTDKKCEFKHQKLDAATQANNFPAATRALELQQEAEECVKHVGPAADEVPEPCQIGKWTNEYRTAAMALHETPLSGVGQPYQAFSMFWSDMRPKTSQHDKWMFVYSHRDPKAWAKDRLENHPTFPVCNIKDSKIAKMHEDDMSPLDPFACLFFCIYNKIATETDGLGKCMTSLSHLGENKAAEAYKQHTDVALRVAKESFKTPVLELNLWSGKGMNFAELVKTFKAFVTHSVPGKRKDDPEFSYPCKHGTDSNPLNELRKADPSETDSISDAEPFMVELSQLKRQLMKSELE